MPALNVNILLHGLFFMTQEGNNLRVYAPVIPNHHFIGGVRGSRRELKDLQDLTGFGLRGKVDPQTGLPAPDPANDIDGSIMQFSPTDVGGLKPPGDPAFIGTILLPWPTKIIALRSGDIKTTFLVDPGSVIGKKIKANAMGKGSTKLGVVALLQYTLPALNSVGGISYVNIHYYLQPCDPHDYKAVTIDLGKAANSFLNAPNFDLRMTGDPTEIDPTGDPNLGTTAEDEQSVDEEGTLSPDIRGICPHVPAAIRVKKKGFQLKKKDSDPAVSPANCPIFFVG
jgi:hypothetical protein